MTVFLYVSCVGNMSLLQAAALIHVIFGTVAVKKVKIVMSV